MTISEKQIIDEVQIDRVLSQRENPPPEQVRGVLAKARELHGLDFDDVAVLMNATSPESLAEMASCARWVKEQIYGNRLVLFAPLYVSNYCSNSCLYCGYRRENTQLKRRALSQEEIAEEVRFLVTHGHERILLLAGETGGSAALQYILDTIGTIYETRTGNGEIRRVNVNIAPLKMDEFRALKAAHIGTYQLFQETYHRETYAKLHPRGPKADYDFRLGAMHRAMEAGIDDVGVGPLLGLYDWRFEVLALMQHIRSLENEFGVGVHTISIPRLEPAVGSELSTTSPYMVNDADFLKIVAILRLAVPYTGMIMSTRERPEIRDITFRLGISQISAGSRVDPGGYSQGPGDPKKAQFVLGDHRSIDDVVREITGMGFIPSFCTACYRLGRTGRDFMDLAKPGEIKYHCTPNALSTFEEYLIDYASPKTRAAGERLIQIELDRMDNHQRTLSAELLDEVKSGGRDVFV
jgi:2-iminoacetate synthase